MAEACENAPYPWNPRLRRSDGLRVPGFEIPTLRPSAESRHFSSMTEAGTCTNCHKQWQFTCPLVSEQLRGCLLIPSPLSLSSTTLCVQHCMFCSTYLPLVSGLFPFLSLRYLTNVLTVIYMLIFLCPVSPHKLPRLLLADSPLKSSPISSPVPLQPLLPPESMHTPNPAAGTEWAVRCDGAALEVDLDVYPQPLPRLSPETISTPQSSMGVLMLAFTYISWQTIVLVMLLTDEQRG